MNRVWKERSAALIFSVLTHVTFIYSLSPGHHDDHRVMWFEGTLELGEAGDGHSERLHFHQESSRKKPRPQADDIHASSAQNEPQSVDLSPQGGSGGGNPSLGGGLGGTSLTEGQRYLLALIQKIDALKTYPKDSLLREEEGLVILTVVIHPEGRIESSEVSEPSPFLSLNRAALEAVRKLPSLPPLPSEWSQSIRVKIPISYRLTR